MVALSDTGGRGELARLFAIATLGASVREDRFGTHAHSFVGGALVTPSV